MAHRVKEQFIMANSVAAGVWRGSSHYLIETRKTNVGTQLVSFSLFALFCFLYFNYLACGVFVVTYIQCGHSYTVILYENSLT